MLSLEVRDGDGSLLGADQQNVGELGWDGAPGQRELRFLLEKLPLGEGEFQVSVALTDAAGTRQYHRVDGAVRFAVQSSDHARGAVRPPVSARQPLPGIPASPHSPRWV